MIVEAPDPAYDDATLAIRPRSSSLDLDVIPPSEAEITLGGDIVPPNPVVVPHDDSAVPLLEEVYVDPPPPTTSRGVDSLSRPHRMVTRSQKKTFFSQVFNISVKKALRIMPEAAIESIMKELAQLLDKKVFVPLLPGTHLNKKTIRSFMFLKEKYLSSGLFDKLKSRLVAGGHEQDRTDLIYEDINSPTAALINVLIVAAIAAREGRKVKTFDVTGAYLNANNADREIYMVLDPIMSEFLIILDPSFKKFQRPDGTIIVKLLKALYGCVESAKLWYNLLSSVLMIDGFVVNPMDPCIYNKTVQGIQITIVIYVDDLFVSSINEALIDDLENLLKAKFHEISTHDGIIHSYLGMSFDFSVTQCVTVSMDGYIQDLLSLTEVTGSAKTPAQDHLFVIRDLPLLNSADTAMFHTLVAKLLYLG
jgi:hypothetical protein